MEVHLFAATSAWDTDWTAKLVHFAPGGFAMNPTDGILRARFRHSYEHPEPETPDKVEKFVIHAGNTCHTFLKAHRRAGAHRGEALSTVENRQSKVTTAVEG